MGGDSRSWVTLRAVVVLFTVLLVLAILGTMWFGGYVVYRLYAEQR